MMTRAPINPKLKIYRIFRKNHFEAMYKNNENVLVNPSKWDDPFENVLLNSKVITGEEVGEFSFHNQVFAQCWTTHTASDAMWQIYSKNRDSVRVQTTVEKLLTSLEKANKKTKHYSCDIGTIRYLSDAQIVELGKTIFRQGIDPESIRSSLLFKRKAYSYEKEVRLVYIGDSNSENRDGLYRFPFSPKDVIEQVMFDGRYRPDNFEIERRATMQLTGLPRKKVLRSSLYTPPKNFEVHIGT